ncbi:MAG: lipoprotein-releasing system ATP-binding protein LolD [Candidatus Cloacimonadota bacterium]|nr:MAG: lipoprotein-releasing system ATP-binding protein LolD [Candidatus Cloacimonadota bacterium]PIE82086.1 MAG: lipoprotein-releasing system ATP-binding protein LolD [Candidatus Delongbacteria bacterium]
MLLRVENLKKYYGSGSSKIEVLKGLSLEVDRGSIVSLIGKSGSGKSTLLNLIGTLDTPDSGEILYDGVSILGLDDKKKARFRNRNIGFIFQAHYLLPEFSSIENVMIPGLISGEKESHVRKRAEKLLEMVGLKDRVEFRSKDLSGGEQQRVAIARGVINSPGLILADEPTGNLDSENSEVIRNILWNLAREENSGLILVTHDLNLAEKADRSLSIVDGVVS